MKWISILIFSLLFVISLSSTALSKSYNVVLFNSYHQGMFWEDKIHDAIRDKFRSQEELNIELFVEYLDTKRYSKELIKPQVKFLLEQKYKFFVPDLIIAVDDNALEILIEEKMYEYFPIIFVGINNLSTATKSFSEYGMTGILEKVDMSKTIRLAMTLHPKAKYVLAIVDDTKSVKHNEKEFIEVSKEFIKEDIEFKVIKGWTFKELTEILNSYPPGDAIILRLSYHKDIKGEIVISKRPDAYFSQFKNPTYTLWKSYGLGDGMVGGYLAYGKAHGEIIADIALKVLMGVSPDSIPIVVGSGNYPFLDYSAIKKFKIDTSEIPESAIIINIPETFYEKYYGYIWVGITSVTLHLIGLIVMIFVLQDKKRLEADNELKNRQISHIRDQLPKINVCAKEKEILPDVSEVFTVVSNVLNKIKG